MDKEKVAQVKGRDSNMELLRIISMIFIVILHFNGFGFKYLTHLPSFFSQIQFVFLSAFESVFIIGVNLFVLISGYYGIKLSIKSIYNIFFTCLFYSVLIYMVKYVLLGDYGTLKDLIKAFLPISKQWWFITIYFCLMLISPLLNAILRKISDMFF
jgi:Acyltransferase family.